MGNYKKIIFSFLLLITSICCYAGQISIQIVQHDSINEKVTEESMSVEDELMTAFFDKGFIVTNSPAVASKSADSDEKITRSGMTEAYDGCSDYFLQVRLFYEDPKNELQKVDWSLYSMTTGKKIKDFSINQFSLTKKKTKDLHKVSVEIVNKTKDAIKA